MFAHTLRRRSLSLCLLFFLSSGLAYAAKPSIEFDFGQTAECREVALPEPASIAPGEKIVELKLRISAHLTTGNLDKVEEVRIEVVDCDRRIRVYRFAPETQLESLVSEDILWSKTTEQDKSLGASLGGQAPVLLGDGIAHITPSINGGKTKREVITETQKRIAPKHVVTTSGTIDGEHGVFFKLRRSPQSSLEGVHELMIQFVVPDTWRGDSVRICCQATGQDKFLWMKQQKTWTHQCAKVAIYLAGDLDARRAAVRYIQQRSTGS